MLKHQKSIILLIHCSNMSPGLTFVCVFPYKQATLTVTAVVLDIAADFLLPRRAKIGQLFILHQLSGFV